MSNIEKLSIALTSELADVVREAVLSGEYASASEVVREALRDWLREREEQAAALGQLRQLVEKSLASGAPKDRAPLEAFLNAVRAKVAGGRAA